MDLDSVDLHAIKSIGKEHILNTIPINSLELENILIQKIKNVKSQNNWIWIVLLRFKYNIDSFQQVALLINGKIILSKKDFS